MKTHPFQFEIIVAGFSHLIWLTLLAFMIQGSPPNKILDYFFALQAGTSVILIAIVGGISYFLGVLAESFFIWISFLKMDEQRRKKKINKYRSKSNYIWNGKSFFRSMAFAICGILLFLLLLDKSQSSKYCCTIVVIGLIIESITIICWLFWKYIEGKISSKKTAA
jgi:hypothetical protein